MKDLPTKADDMFCFAVYRASHAINQTYAPHLKRLGLTYPQYITLTLLWDQDNQRVSDLAKRLEMNTNTVTPLLQRLEKLGHITRTKDKLDARQVRVELTESGRSLQDQAPDIVRCIVEATGMMPDELDGIVTVLNRLTEHMGAADTSSD